MRSKWKLRGVVTGQCSRELSVQICGSPTWHFPDQLPKGSGLSICQDGWSDVPKSLFPLWTLDDPQGNFPAAKLAGQRE